LLLFEDPSVTTGKTSTGPAYGRNSEFYYNPLIKSVNITVEGVPNVLYPQGTQSYQLWDEIIKGWPPGVPEGDRDFEHQPHELLPESLSAVT
jgi:hypothetical protein